MNAVSEMWNAVRHSTMSLTFPNTGRIKRAGTLTNRSGSYRWVSFPKATEQQDEKAGSESEETADR
jgi:hypothetical protein